LAGIAAILLILLSLGEALNSLLKLPLHSDSLFDRIAIDIATGTALIPLISLALTPFKALNFHTTVAIVLLASLIALYGIREKRSLCWGKPSALTILLALILLFSALLRFVPIVGMYVYPGDDAKMHTLLTRLIVENNGYPSSWGHYAPPGKEQSPVSYPLGFHSIVAFTYFMINQQIPLPQLVLIITQFYNLLIVLSLYYLASKLLNRVLGVTSALTIGIVSQAPLLFFWWGGNSELAATFLFLTLIPLILFLDS
jgi:hypothetical protein